MQKLFAFGSGIRWAFLTLVAVGVVSTAAARPAAAQVFEGNLTLTTQAQVDAFAYTEVTGFLNIHEDGTDPISNVDGLSRLTKVGVFLAVQLNASLTDVDGLSGLTEVGNLVVAGNDSLTNLDGLSGLTMVGHRDVIVGGNGSLTDFCGLYSLLAGDFLPFITFDIVNNAKNPTEQEILDAGPCDPADTIGELIDAGAFTMVQADVLLHLADRSLEGLRGILMGFAASGILTPTEAQLLFVIASNWQGGI